MEDVELKTTSIEDAHTRLKATVIDLERCGPELGDVVKEFNALWAAVSSEHTAEENLISSVRETLRDLDSCKSDMLAAQSQTTEQAQTRDFLEAEVTRMADSLMAVKDSTEEKLKASEELRGSVAALESSLSHGAGWTEDQKQRKTDLERKQKELTVAAERENGTVSALRRDLAVLDGHLERGTAAIEAIEADMTSTQEAIATVTAATAKKTAAKEAQDGVLRSKQAVIDDKHKHLAELQTRLKELDETAAKNRRAVKTKNQEVTQFLANYNAVNKQAAQLTADLDTTLVNNNQIAAELNDIAERTRLAMEDAARSAKDTATKKQLHELCQEKIAAMHGKIGKVEEVRAGLEDKKRALAETIAKEEANNRTLQRAAEDLAKEREILQRGVTKVADKAAAVETVIQVQLGGRKSTETDIMATRNLVRTLRETVTDLEDEVDKREEELKVATQKGFAVQEQLKLQSLHITSMQRSMKETGSKMATQQHMYETVRADRNRYNKELVVLQDEINSITDGFKATSHQVEQLKEEISTKDHTLVKEHFEHHTVEKQIEATRNDLTRTNRHIAAADTIISRQREELRKLEGIVADADREASRQRKEFGGVITERDALHQQLNARDAELNSLYEKLKLQRSELDKGARSYAAQSETLATVMHQVAELKAERNESVQRVSSLDTLKHELLHLEKDLTNARAKRIALEEEQTRPMNIHRWRRLVNTDPATHSKLQRLQALQKRLIEATEELAKKDALIKAKEKVYLELKRVLARQPGPEVVEQLTLYQQNLKQKQKQLRAMELELKMYKGNVEEHKYAIDKLSQQAQHLDKSFVRQSIKARTHRAAPPPAVDYAAGDIWGEDGKVGSEAPVTTVDGVELADLGAVAPPTDAATHEAATGE